MQIFLVVLLLGDNDLGPYSGAVKSNVEGANGIAGLIKIVMVLEKRAVPLNANFERINPQVHTNFLNIQVLLLSDSGISAEHAL